MVSQRKRNMNFIIIFYLHSNIQYCIVFMCCACAYLVVLGNQAGSLRTKPKQQGTKTFAL